MEEAKKMKCYKRLIYKQFVQDSDLLGSQFQSYLPNCFNHLCRDLYGDAILVYSSKSDHRRTSALLRNIRNIRICMGKKPIVSVTYENERISIKNSLSYLKRVLLLSMCSPRADLWPFFGFLGKRFSLYIKVHQGWGLQRSSPADLLKKNDHKFAPKA